MATSTLKTAGQAVSYAKSVYRWTVAMCLNFVWHCLDYPRSAGLQNANQSWTAATMKRTNGNPPAGACVYWAVGRYGHIALSLGGGYVRSTDWPSKGSVGTVSISRLSSAWGATYRGWSADYAGHPIPGVVTATYPGPMTVDMGAPIYAHNLRPEARNNDTARFEKAIWNKLGGPYRQSIVNSKQYVGDGYYGTITQEMCRDAYQAFNGTRYAYPGGTQMLKWLGFKDARV